MAIVDKYGFCELREEELMAIEGGSTEVYVVIAVIAFVIGVLGY